VPLTLVKLQEYQKGPLPGDVLHRPVDGASFLHGILGETFWPIYVGILSIPWAGETGVALPVFACSSPPARVQNREEKIDIEK
jgi:hypothetical protein